MENQDLLHVSPDVQEKIEKLITENEHFKEWFNSQK